MLLEAFSLMHQKLEWGAKAYKKTFSRGSNPWTMEWTGIKKDEWLHPSSLKEYIFQVQSAAVTITNVWIYIFALYFWNLALFDPELATMHAHWVQKFQILAF
jgi:hypothetical protein